jgi:hypothetical protein
MFTLFISHHTRKHIDPQWDLIYIKWCTYHPITNSWMDKLGVTLFLLASTSQQENVNTCFEETIPKVCVRKTC